MKVIKCPECGAEQAIARNEDGTMTCMFCGKIITDLPPYEENEGLGDEVTEENNLSNTEGEPCDASFILSRDEVETALVLTGRLKSRKYILWIETALLGIATVGAIVTIIAGLTGYKGAPKPTANTYFMLAVIIALIPAVWLMPKRTKKRILDNAVTGSNITARVYENLIELSRDNEQPWQLMFDGSYTVINEQGLLLLALDNRQLVVIPERAFADNELEKAKERIMNGSANQKKATE